MPPIIRPGPPARQAVYPGKLIAWKAVAAEAAILLGRPATSFAEFAARNAAAFLGGPPGEVRPSLA